MTVYDLGAHCVFYNLYHIVWATKYRYKVLTGEIRLRARDIIRQTCGEMGVNIDKGVLAQDHVHMFLSVPPKHSVSDVMRRIKGRSSRRLQQEFPALRKR
ncbi:MAG: IS200/IS605 family transposase, partial [Pseudorhodobacter sp.]